MKPEKLTSITRRTTDQTNTGFKSMTGYGSADLKRKNLLIKTEIRTVNHRFLNLKINIPESLIPFERFIEKEVQQAINRGTVNLTVRIEQADSGQGFKFNHRLLRHYYQKLQNLKRSLNISEDISLSTLLNLPGVLEASEKKEGTVFFLWSAAQKTIRAALADLLLMREREGRRLKKEMEKIIKQMSFLLKKTSSRQPEVVKNYARALEKRVRELMEKSRVNADQGLESDLAREIAFFAQRSDITEEIHRLKSHLNEFQHSLETSSPVGKKLDFLTQEILREVNTIASKSNDTRISLQAVELKNSVEKIKEQVQNIE
ncbi:MAG: YicC/YloC family endoribonuclease [Planctomycetota bacterium]